MIQKVILETYKRLKPEGNIVCCAPTGRAARKMHQSTGFPASTIHKALGLMADDDGDFKGSVSLDADLVIADEVSMLDIYLADQLFGAMPFRSQLVLVGDSDQLPSVGPGSVLYELLESGEVPSVRLDTVFRQAHGSRIAVNASLIKNGNLALEYGPDFELIESADLERSADILESAYLKKVDELGVDNVALLSPFRTRTSTGVNALNLRIRDKLNPASPTKPEVRYGKRVFRVGDRVTRRTSATATSARWSVYRILMTRAR